MAPFELAAAADDASMGDSFTLNRQQLELDFSFAPRQVKGRTTLEIQPDKPQLRQISLHCRQLTPTNIKIDGQKAAFTYSNLHQHLTLYPGNGLGQYHIIKNRIKRHLEERDDELVIYVPDSIKVREVKPSEAGMADDAQGIFYATFKLEIEYELNDFRDALHFAGVEDGDLRFPHAYTRNSPFPGTASCLFPCIDDGEQRTIFELSIRYPRTLGDALSKNARGAAVDALAATNSIEKADSVMLDADDDEVDLSEEEKAMEMQVICSGTLTDDIVDPTDASRKTASFDCGENPVLPQHIGFVIGPFQHVDLSEYRDTVDDERLGENAIKVHAFCLPGKEDEVRNSGMILARALDTFTERFQSYAFGNAYKLAFVDDLEYDTTHTASFSICSSRLLFPETVWEPLEYTTRVLVHAVASQWIGVDVVAHNAEDYWIIVGGSWFMAELYLRDLFGRNDWRFRQKLMVDKVIQMDKKRPSLQRLGEYVRLDPAEREFMELKSLMVLSILHNRLVKQSGKNGVDRCLYRMLFNARQGKYSNGAIATDDFLDICEKVGHQKLESFFAQWVYGSGCPIFQCFPSFNKKKQVVQLQITQEQAQPSITRIESGLTAEDFMREAKEKGHEVQSGTEYPTFVGPMTIRIHEADGTPYEHIVDINSASVKVEIPYNTKYKRLKRNRLNKERMAAAAGLDASGETQEDVTFYMLGDLFTTPEEHAGWRLDDWPAEDEAKQEQEAYEWIRIDADFEWICKTVINDMPSYMYVSQLQQDKDVVAQAESIQFLAQKEGHKLISTFLIKTLMDSRYFHGIRTMAAEVMAQSALKRTEWIGLFHLKKAFRELFCIPGSPMTRSNDFTDRSSYLIQCAIPRAIAKIRGEDGRAPMEVKRFLLDVLQYNDNRGNDYSDDHYISTLMRCLADCLISSKNNNDDLSPAEWAAEQRFQEKAIGELTRYQRLDEWIPTYQNIYTTTALECATKLTLNRVTPFKPSEFLQYAQLGNADNVRLKAWECLVRLGLFRKDSVLRFMIHELRSDPSPYFRKQLLRIFGVAVGQIATGDVWMPEKTTGGSSDTLVVEDAGNLERASALARQNLEGALRELKSDLKDNQTLRLAIESALQSTTLSTSDMSELVDFCDMVFDHLKQNRLLVKLKYPRYWKAEHLGKGNVRFSKTDKIRMKPMRPFQPPEPARSVEPVVLPPPPRPVPLPKLSLKLGGIKMKPAAASPAASPPIVTDSPLVLKNSSNLMPTATTPAATPAPASTKASPLASPVIKDDSRASSPDIPLKLPAMAPPKKQAPPAPTPLVRTPVPLPKPAAPRPAPAPARPPLISVPAAIATPPAIQSPIPLPAPKLKIRTKNANGSAVPSPRPSAAPSPRPSAGPSPRNTPAPSPRHTVPPPSRPTPSSSSSSSAPVASAPKPPRPKKSKIVKLRVPPAALARIVSESNRKRKLGAAEDDRPFKRQSLEPGGAGAGSGAGSAAGSAVAGAAGAAGGSASGNGKTGLVRVERSRGDRIRMIVKIKFSKGRLSGFSALQS
ncbi:hypothetical protein LEMA_P023870.1 [Plenodomus lingam JN3]|uniref:Transcription initiation factor TFIID subunit 2 n=1 Tax=Leptosphaeria maculans (strain JN3 / isolate v23.1.3 / race Av1-4-5-6-7-8) TaxID=985895 RepID=E4ZX25_LEPMJ|nr:hypothetical protein LEMA_P023870.1 [Plenodomus lingam JN3]CBX95235.1 hypothetical protein LEMA_P023870.1 [Plenodomus lingam JN3]